MLLKREYSKINYDYIIWMLLYTHVNYGKLFHKTFQNKSNKL